MWCCPPWLLTSLLGQSMIILLHLRRHCKRNHSATFTSRKKYLGKYVRDLFKIFTSLHNDNQAQLERADRKILEMYYCFHHWKTAACSTLITWQRLSRRPSDQLAAQFWPCNQKSHWRSHKGQIPLWRLVCPRKIEWHPFDPYTAIDLIGKLMSEIFHSFGSWDPVLVWNHIPNKAFVWPWNAEKGLER